MQKYLNGCSLCISTAKQRCSMLLRESDKHFLWSLLGAIGIVLFWRGIWAGIDIMWEIPGWEWVATPALSMFLGLTILTLSGLIFREFDPLGGMEKGALKILHNVHTHPEKKDFTITYYDHLQKKEIVVPAHKIKKIEKNILSIHERGKETFIPIHRVRAVHHKGKAIWRI
ncbi:MAG TPA: RNA repair domain-containing protein [Candidatus Nanoarchaeia archaeon]|nr:RNA repair domain-containing protein [Candidatus Nanoarchaeia archaeon]